MSRMRKLGAGVLAAALIVGGAACSDDEPKATESDRPPISFEDAPEGSTDIGICYAYDVDQIKDLIGGEETFKRLAPEAIGDEGAAVTGEACAWERTEPNGDAVNLRIEIRDYGDDQAGLLEAFADLKSGTPGAASVEGLGDENGAFAAETEETSLLQVKSGQYLLTLSSRAEGDLQPVDLAALELLAASGLEAIE